MERNWPVVIILFVAVSGAWAQEAAPPQATSPFADPNPAVDESNVAIPEANTATPIAPPQQTVYFTSNDSAGDQRVRDVLSQPLSGEGLEFTETPLEEVVNLLREEWNVEFQIDKVSLDDLGIDDSEPVACSLRNVRRDVALKYLLKQLNLTSVVTNGMLMIMADEEAETRLATGIYPVADLLYGDRSQALNDLVDAILSTVATDTWAENGGGEAEIRYVSPGFLFISQTQHVHTEVTELLITLRLAQRENPVHVLPVTKRTPKETGGNFCGENHPANRGGLEPTPANSDENTRAGGGAFGGGGGGGFGGGGGGGFGGGGGRGSSE